MLRRYNSVHLDTIHLKGRKTTLGSGANCDIVLKGRGIAEVHASIESNSAGYFLKDVSLTSRTRVNDKPVFGQFQINTGDTIQLGSAVVFIFDSEWVVGTRPNSAKHKMPRLSGGSIEKPIVGESSSTSLPMITGTKIRPQTLSSDSSLKKRNTYHRFGRGVPSESHSLRSSASSTESQERGLFGSRSVGHSLLQRVVKLEAELADRDERLRISETRNAQPTVVYYHPSLPPPHLPLQAPPISVLPLQGPLDQTPPPQVTPLRRFSTQKTQKSFELYAYRAFVGAVTSQIRQFNDRIIRHPQRDSAEMFNAMCRAVDVPLSSRITEIEKYVEAVLIENDFEESEALNERIGIFIQESRRDKIMDLFNEMEVIMPIFRDAAAYARENIRACNVFTQWSRGFGASLLTDMLRKNSFSAAVLFQAIEDLKTQFAEANMSHHWLPPSIIPILRIAALELEKRDGNITPSASPRHHGILDRKKSIDMTLENCLSQVEAIIHEMDYHLTRLCNKARYYSAFQTLDLNTVTRISKIVDSFKSSMEILSEHSFKDERPNSVLFFEVTNDDLKNSIRKSDSESSSGSLNSLKKVSVAPKNPEIFSEDEEILEERKEVDEELMRIIARISDNFGMEESEQPMRNKGMISVDATVLKTLIQQSQRLLNTYESSKQEELVRRKRSAPPIIMVEDDVIHDVLSVEAEKLEKTEAPKSSEDFPLESEKSGNFPNSSEAPEVPEYINDALEPSGPPICAEPLNPHDAPLDLEKSEVPETPILQPSAPPESPKDSENPPESILPPIMVPPLVLTTSLKDSTTPEVLSPRESAVPNPPEAPPPGTFAPEDPNFGRTSSEASTQAHCSEDVKPKGEEPDETPKTPKYPTPDHVASGSDLPFTLIMPEQPTNPPGSESGSFEDVRNYDDVVKESEDSEDVKDEDSEKDQDTINDDSESEDEKSTIRYIPSESTPQELTPQNSQDVSESFEDVEKNTEKNTKEVIEPDDVMTQVKPLSNGHVVRETRSEDRMSSHLKSHFNTANGKPHIVYQYPIRQDFSPPMKRRSKSEDQKIRETLKNRPRFVLY